MLALPDPLRAAARPLRRRTTGPGSSACSPRPGAPALRFDQTLNNHTVAAYSAFFALYPSLRIWDDGERLGWLLRRRPASSARFCACNELPAALFGVLLFVRAPGPVPEADARSASSRRRSCRCVGVPGTQYLAFGQFKPVYEEFGTSRTSTRGATGTRRWRSTGSTCSPSPQAVYLFHMTLRPPRRLLAHADLPVLPARRVARRSRPDAAACRRSGLADARADGGDAGVLHLEPQGAELRRLDPGPALAVLADPVLAGHAARRASEPGQDRRGYRWLSLLGA